MNAILVIYHHSTVQENHGLMGLVVVQYISGCLAGVKSISRYVALKSLILWTGKRNVQTLMVFLKKKTDIKYILSIKMEWNIPKKLIKHRFRFIGDNERHLKKSGWFNDWNVASIKTKVRWLLRKIDPIIIFLLIDEQDLYRYYLILICLLIN